MENEKQKEIMESNSKKEKFNLVIDYSKFQNNFMSNLKKEEKKDKNITEDKDNKINGTQKSKNYDQFLNVSDILNENMSQSSLLDIENQKNKNDIDNNKIKENKITSKLSKTPIFNNISDNFSIGESDEQNLFGGYNDLMLSYNGNNSNKKKKSDKTKKENELNKPSLNSSKKKRNYVKFINKNNLELELSKTIEKEKTSYAKINEKNRLFKEKNYKSKFVKKNDKFNLLNEEINHNYNNSVLTLSDISMVPSTTTTVDFITGNSTSNNLSNKSYYNKKVNKIKTVQNFQNSKSITNKNNRNNKRTYSNEHTYHNINELKLGNYNNNNIDKKRKKSYERKNNLMVYVNKTKSDESSEKKDDLIYLLDNIKAKYKNQENEYINQQKNMESEIEILREKLKTLSVNEALYQVEIEKLKRKNTNNDENNNNNINHNNDSIKNINLTEKKNFENQLDDIIMKHNKESNNNNLYSFSKKPPNSKMGQLLEYFNLDKDLFSDDNNFLDNEESFNFEKAFIEYPQIKKFIELLVEKYKNEKEYRTRLEEKTVEIFTNDMKTINILEKKIKKYEEKNSKHYKNNSSLNVSLEAGLSDTKNSNKSCKSCDKII